MAITTPAQTAYTLWLEANNEATEFYKANVASWNAEVGATFRQFRDKADQLFLEWRAEDTGLSVTEVEARMNEAIHSARD